MKRGWNHVALVAALFLVVACSSEGAGPGAIGTPIGVNGGDGAPDTGGAVSLDDVVAAAPDVGPGDSNDESDAVGEQPTGPTDPDDEFGKPCEENNDCLSGWCVEGPTGYMCTESCLEDCPDGFACKSVQGKGDVVFLCLPKLTKLCAPCEVDAHCAGGSCVDLTGETRCVQRLLHSDLRSLRLIAPCLYAAYAPGEGSSPRKK